MASLAKTNRPFRHAQFKALSRKSFPLKNLNEPSPTAHSITVGGQYIAAGYGAKGSVIVLPGKFKTWTRVADLPTISAHGMELGDLAWSPFNDSLLATAGREGTVKLWSVPAGGLTANLTTATATFDGIDGGANQLRWHPSAEGVLALGCKSRIGIIDTVAGVEKYKFMVDSFGKDVMGVNWNYDGSLLSAVGKNGVVALIDPRNAPAEAMVSATKLTNIQKPQHALWVGREVKNHIAVVGLGAAQRPTLNFFDIKDMSRPIAAPTLELSTGVTLPIYDIDTDLFFLSIRGSLAVSIFDIGVTKTGTTFSGPGWVPTHSFTCDTGIKGAALAPKRALNLNKSEVDRYYVLGQDTIQPYSLRVPRKVRGFHADLYPDTFDYKASQSAEEYFGGANRDPNLIGAEAMAAARGSELKSAPAAEVKSPTAAAPAPAAARAASPPAAATSPTAAGAASPTSPTSPASPSAPRPESKQLRPSSSAGTAAPGAPAPAPGSAPRPGAAAATRGSVGSVSLSSKRTSIDTAFARSPFQHTAAHEPNERAQTYYDLAPAETLPLCMNLQVNSKFWAMPWRVSGGSAVAVWPLAKYGRNVGVPLCVRGHKTQVTCFDLSQVDPCLIATANAEGQAKVYRIPEAGLTTDLTEPIADLPCLGKVSLVRFHPYVDNLLVTASWGGADTYVHFWDIKEQKQRIEIQGLHGDQILDIAFERTGKLIATTCKDKMLRVLDPRFTTVVGEVVTPQSERDTRVLWVDSERLITCGFGSGGSRSFSLWDIKDMKKPVVTQALESNNATAIPCFDEASQILFVANNGGLFVQLYQIKKAAPWIEALDVYKTVGDVTGLAFLPKTSCDVKAVEVAKSLKLSRDKIVPMSWTIPRKRLEYFQDDLFPETRAPGALYTSDEWFEAKLEKEVPMISMCPAGMTPLSQAPAEALTARQQTYVAFNEAKKEAATNIKRGILGHTSEAEVKAHFQGVAAAGMLNSNRWDAKPDKSREDVSEDEW